MHVPEHHVEVAFAFDDCQIWAADHEMDKGVVNEVLGLLSIMMCKRQRPIH
jgi:hypothetical protein